MNLAAQIQEVSSISKSRQKRLGQFFTGVPLAKLLAALSDARSANSIIDPMAGRGDMLIGCIEYGAKPKQIGAIEIDGAAFKKLSLNVMSGRCFLGSAFDPAIIDSLPLKQWELVMTNPPYVRYQSFSGQDAGGLPSSIEIRNGLLNVLGSLDALDDEDRRLFRVLIENYSGLADLAVPSWILSAGLCAVGGRIALVVPESWLSREYAAVVQYLLLRWFRIEFVVEDVDASWFSDAQVKTNLLVARRVARRDSAFSWKPKDSFLKIKIGGAARGANGVVSRAFGEAAESEKKLASLAKDNPMDWRAIKEKGIAIQHASLGLTANNLQRSIAKHRWITKLEPHSGSTHPHNFFLPDALASWCSEVSPMLGFTTLDALGVSVGQGLRTGANEFFYATEICSVKGGTTLVSSELLGAKQARLPKAIALPALRRQSELPDGYVIRTEELSSRVLALQKHALPEDIAKSGNLARKLYKIAPDGLQNWIREAEQLNWGDQHQIKRVSELSAVAPNIRKGDEARGLPPRFWYMLPDLAPRHLPDLLLARVNGSRPKVFLNVKREAVVDANFSTIWRGNDAPDGWALLALLNSSWCAAALEYSAAVMGGGALKVEANHLARLPIPLFTGAEWLSLSKAGKALALRETDTIKYNIDALVVSRIIGHSATRYNVESLRALVSNATNTRQRRRKEAHD